MLKDAVDRRQVDADQHQVTLTIAGTSGTQVLGSERQLGVAVGNLVENAVVYSDPGARVVVAAHVLARSDDDYVEITVSDNGIGIPAGELERIFERFYRVDYGRSRANGGTGLGLSIVKHIAAIHGGDVAVWSQPGRGSTFTIKIPAHLHDHEKQSGPAAASTVRGVTRRLRSTRRLFDDEGLDRRGRGVLPRGVGVHARQGGLRGGRGGRRGAGHRRLRPGRRRHRAPRPDDARAARHRGLPPAALPRPGPGDHGHRAGLRDRQGRRPGARRGRLCHQAVQPPRTGGPDPGRAAPGPRHRTGARHRRSRPGSGWTWSATRSRSTASGSGWP